MANICLMFCVLLIMLLTCRDPKKTRVVKRVVKGQRYHEIPIEPNKNDQVKILFDMFTNMFIEQNEKM